MKQKRLNMGTRVLVAVCGLAMIAVLFVPIWKIELSAPQYPEGLHLRIFANRLGGDVDIINGLNHYIGMKPLQVSDFPEFRVLPWCMIFFAVLLLMIALAGRRNLLNGVFGLLVCFGILAIIDFWRWEYNYGHNLNPDAAIVVPGMSYQPPLIGYKQLLNFGAWSVPDSGGWILAGIGSVLLFLVARERKSFKEKKSVQRPLADMALLYLFLHLTSCESVPAKITRGKDPCDFCKMTIIDNHFGAVLITKKGKAYKFDDPHCLLSFLQQAGFTKKQLGTIWFTDFSFDHSLINVNRAYFLRSEDLESPMKGNIAAFSNEDSLKKAMRVYKGMVITWKSFLEVHE